MTGFTQITLTNKPTLGLIPLSIVITILLTACASSSDRRPALPTQPVPPVPSQPSQTEGSASRAIAQLLSDERSAIVARDLDWLAALWAEDATIIDGRGTVSTDDDYVWQGKAAVLDRYMVAVFDSPPSLLSADDIPVQNLVINQTGETATLQTDVDNWVFQRQDQEWRLHRLSYNMSPP